ncbi:alkaline ceramidase 3-like [Amphiura filiformis]|uniref:alkaline ceramidase 3-like n=1 Tax=Amphiura filiformis TaxID=82378 RepID=UPI003B224648
MAPAPPSSKDLEGFWGEPTSTLDWCEENYVVSYYIAEFWNTVSNLAIILPPILAMGYFTKYQQIETRYYVACILMTIVGIGSWCFHMTLLFEMQMLDELPMIYGCCVLVYCAFQTDGKKQESNLSLALAVGLFLCAVTITIVYLTIQDPIFHQVCYGILVVSIIGRGIYCMRSMGHSRYLFIYSVTSIIGAFGIWNIDNIFCSQIRSWRDSLPFPLSVLTQGHMWWHIWSGIGVYVNIMYSLHLRSSYLQYSPKIKHVASFPYLSLAGAGTEKTSVDSNENHYH